jgi:hypothetical protein
LASYFYANGWDEEKIVPRRLQTRCITCQRIESRIRLGIKKRGVSFEAHRPSLRVFNNAEYKRQCREDYVQNKDKINLRRRRVYANQIYAEKNLDVKPFRKWLLEWHSHPDNQWIILAEAMNINESRLNRIANQESQKSVTLDFVDRCLIAAGGDTMLWELYDID